MKGWLAVSLASIALSSNVWAAPKSCAELKQEIEVKIQAAGVDSYTLEIVSSDEEAADGSMVIGTCDNGSKKVIYQRNDFPGSARM